MATYVALIHGTPGAYGFSVPDLPGCTSAGDTLDAALRRGHDAVADWVEAQAAAGSLPEPRPLEVLQADPDVAGDFDDAVAVALIQAEVPGRAVRLNITLDEALAARIDRAAAAAGETRSGWLADAARTRLKGKSRRSA